MKDISRYERQFILKEIGRGGQRQLGRSRVAVVGLGALGSVSANLLARAGVGQLLLIDRDFVEKNNLQRQILFDERDAQENLPKAVAAKKKLGEVNSEIKIECEVEDLNPLTAEALLGRADLVVDGTDNFESRFLMNDFSLKKKIPWIYGGAVRTEGMSYVILPGRGPCLRCLFDEAPGANDIQTCDQAGILASVAHLIAAFQVTEAIKILTGKLESVERKLWKVDLWRRELKALSVSHLEKTPCPGCREGDYVYLERKSVTRAVTLCGRNAVQIDASEGRGKINLERLAGRLAGQTKVEFNPYLLKCRLSSFEMTVFASGRAIVKGTEDAGQAKSLYAKYVGV